jgi:FXSXX-COOH protein
VDTTPGTNAKPVVIGVIDTRSTPLDQLAGEGFRTARESLRRVLPAGEPGRVSVARFGSSI